MRKQIEWNTSHPIQHREREYLNVCQATNARISIFSQVYSFTHIERCPACNISHYNINLMDGNEWFFVCPGCKSETTFFLSDEMIRARDATKAALRLVVHNINEARKNWNYHRIGP